MPKVGFYDRRVMKTFQEMAAGFFAVVSGFLIFVDIPETARLPIGLVVLAIAVLGYLVVWRWADNLNAISIDIEGSSVDIKVGDIFAQDGLKVIAFNEYFDTLVDDRLISRASLNGIFIEKHALPDVAALNTCIDEYLFDPEAIEARNVGRQAGRTTRYRLGTICVYGDYLLTAFSKFDDNNRATLTMPQYLEFLIAFWDQVNRVYAQKNVSTAIFGSGITRIRGHRNISDEDLLKIMLWTFRISEMRFKYPARLTIIIHVDKIDRINLLDIKAARNGV